MLYLKRSSYSPLSGRVAFRAEMIALMRGLLELEEALLADDNEAAQAALRKVREMEDPGHERFTSDE